MDYKSQFLNPRLYELRDGELQPLLPAGGGSEKSLELSGSMTKEIGTNHNCWGGGGIFYRIIPLARFLDEKISQLYLG